MELYLQLFVSFHSLTAPYTYKCLTGQPLIVQLVIDHQAIFTLGTNIERGQALRIYISTTLAAKLKLFTLYLMWLISIIISETKASNDVWNVRSSKTQRLILSMM